MNDNILIRAATDRDAEPLTVLSRKTFIDAFAQLNDTDNFNAYVEEAFTPVQILSEIQDPACIFFIAELDNNWVGYAKLHQSLPPECVNKRPAIELSRLYCLQECLGYGIGQALMKACIAHARKYDFKAVWLGSWKENHRGNAFYRKMQFEIFGTKTFTLGEDVQEDHVFVRSLSGL